MGRRGGGGGGEGRELSYKENGAAGRAFCWFKSSFG